MIRYILQDYLPALGITIVIETIVALILGLRKRDQLLTVGLASVVTHPILHCIILIVCTFSMVQSPLPLWLILSLEVCVVAAETVILRTALKLPLWRSALVAFIMNLASFLAGFLLTTIFPG